MRIAVITLLLSSCGWAADLSSLYGADQLEAQRKSLQRELDLVIAQEIRPFLTEEQARAFSNIRLDLPAVAPPDPNPLDFYSPQAGHLAVPLLTIAFVEDMGRLCVAVGKSLQLANGWRVSWDVARTAARRLSERHNPSPLVALHISAHAMDDPAVAKMAQRVRGTTLSFLILHQFGHLSYVSSFEESAFKRDPIEAGEERADAFALEVMKKNSETPAGLLMLIHGMMYLPTSAPKDHPLTERAESDCGLPGFTGARVFPRMARCHFGQISDSIISRSY